MSARRELPTPPGRFELEPGRAVVVAQLQRGDRLVVRYGSHGQQLAEVLARPDAFRPGRVRVRKWRARSGTWTGAVVVGAGDVLGFARMLDVQQRAGVRRAASW